MLNFKTQRVFAECNEGGTPQHNKWILVIYVKNKRNNLVCKEIILGAPGWLSWLSVWLLLLSWSRPTSGSVLTAQSLEPVLDSVSPSLSAPPPSCARAHAHTLSLPLSKINIICFLKSQNGAHHSPHKYGNLYWELKEKLLWISASVCKYSPSVICQTADKAAALELKASKMTSGILSSFTVAARLS